MFSREKKRLVYALFWGVLFLLIMGALADFFFVPEPTCSDGKQNQNEARVDCGGVCAPCERVIQAKDIQILEKYVIPISSGRYDLVAFIKNPNDLFGTGAFDYTFHLLDDKGEVFQSIPGTSYILPAQDRYIMELEIISENVPAGIDLVIEPIQWEEFLEYEFPKLNVTNKFFEILSSGPEYAKATAMVWNDSPYDFETVEIFVALRDESGSIIGINRTDMQTVNAGEKRDFPVYWKNVIEGKVVTVDVSAITNMFKNQNFIKRFSPTGRFQEYKTE